MTILNLTNSKFCFKGLFHRVILMSGSVFAPWASVREPLKYAVQLGKYFNCSIPEDLNQNHEKITDCLRKIPADSLLTAKVRFIYVLDVYYIKLYQFRYILARILKNGLSISHFR